MFTSTEASKWLNENQGVLSVSIFVITIAFGWASGIFTALRRRPKFRIELIEGPTFCCTFTTGQKYNGYEVHRTGIATYLSVSNVGSAASSIVNVSVGYHWHLNQFNLLWLRYSLGWYWLKRHAIALTDFQAAIGDNIKVFPFLLQSNNLSPRQSETFLQVGQSTNGVVYFEQDDSWGGCFPSPKNELVTIKICVEDAFHRKHKAKFRIPVVTMEYARRYNPSFGLTIAELRGELLPIDTDTQLEPQS